MSQLSDLYVQAVNSGDHDAANYYAQALAAQAGLPIQGVTAASPAQVNAAPAQSSGGGFPFSLPALPSLSDALKGISNGFGPGSILGGIAAVGAAEAPAATGAVSSVGSAFDFITDVPRVVTTVLGIILIIAGIFALTKTNPIEIVSKAASVAAVTA